MWRCALIASLSIIMPSCKPTAPAPVVTNSQSIADLRDLVELPHTMVRARWESFVYPEETDDFLPDNYQATILVAEIAPADAAWFESDQEIRAIWPVSNAVRTWLSESSKRILRDQPLHIKQHSCKYFEANVIATKAVAPGYVCKSSGKVLLYLVLDHKS